MDDYDYVMYGKIFRVKDAVGAQVRRGYTRPAAAP